MFSSVNGTNSRTNYLRSFSDTIMRDSQGISVYNYSGPEVLNEPVHEKTNNLGSDQVQHKPACTVTEETQDLENLGISRGGNVLSV